MMDERLKVWIESLEVEIWRYYSVFDLLRMMKRLATTI